MLAIRIRQKVDVFRRGRPVPDWVFTGRDGNGLQRARFRKVLWKFLEKAGLRRVRIHDLRHCYATIRSMRGHNIWDVSRQLGHSSIFITYDLYGHWVPGSFKREADDLDRAHHGRTLKR